MGKWLPEDKRLELTEQVKSFFDEKDPTAVTATEALRFQVTWSSVTVLANRRRVAEPPAGASSK